MSCAPEYKFVSPDAPIAHKNDVILFEEKYPLDTLTHQQSVLYWKAVREIKEIESQKK